MIAYLLCAGFGTRMRPLTDDTPKSLLPVAGRPILDYLMDELADWTALDAVHVVVNHRDAETFRHWAERWRSKLSANLHVHDDGVRTPEEQLGAVGDLQFVLQQTGVPSNGALVSGGDSLYRFPLSPLLNTFDGATSRVLALYEPDPATLRQRSVLQLDDSRVERIVENPDEPPSHRVCPSWYLLTAEALTTVDAFLRQHDDADTLGAFVNAAAQQSPVEAVRLPLPNLRHHCNTPDDLERAQSALRDGPRYLLENSTVRERLRR